MDVTAARESVRRRILLIEESPKSSDALEQLHVHGYEVQVVSDLDEPWEQYQPCDLLICGNTLTWKDKVECRVRTRKSKFQHHPILMLIGAPQAALASLGMKNRLDHYLVAPFATIEFIIKIERVIRRAQARRLEPSLEIDDLTLNPNTLEVCRGGRSIHLSPTARRILEILMREPGRYISKEELEEKIWAGISPPPASVRPRLCELRKAIDRPFAMKLLHTSKGRGYRISQIQRQSTTVDEPNLRGG